MKYAGMHWPENAGGEHPSREAIVELPGVRQGTVLICSPSARYHYNFAQAHSPLVIWRAIPRVDKLPAKLGWDANAVADECLHLWDGDPDNPQQHSGIEYFLPLNELQFDKENGAPFPGYGEMAQNLGRLRLQLIRKFRQQHPESDMFLMFPAWVPQDEMDHLDDWRGEALLWDSLCLHAYGDAETIYQRYQSYRAAFPHQGIYLGEWNGPGERETLSMLAELARDDWLFVGASYYIWETNNPGEYKHSVWGNADRLALFQDPPLVSGSIDPLDPPVEETPTVAYPRGVDVASYQGFPDYAAVAASGVRFVISKATEGTDYVAPTFVYDWRETKANGMYRFAYHFGRPDIATPEIEADFFWSTVTEQYFTTGDGLALDLEDINGSFARAKLPIAQYALRFLRRVRELCGFAPLLYTSPATIYEHGLNEIPEFSDFGLWLASWGLTQMPDPPPPWPIVAFWQYGVGASGTVPGIYAGIDLDYFNGEEAAIPKYGLPAGPVLPPADPPVEPRQPLVGSGLANALVASNDTPAHDEVFFYNQDGSVAYSIVHGMSGRPYKWIPAIGQVFLS